MMVMVIKSVEVFFKLSRVMSLMVFVFVMSACKHTEKADNIDFVDKTESASVLYNHAIYNIKKKNFSIAYKKLKKIDEQHPYSELSRKALLMGIFVSYSEGDYDSAVNSGKRYVSLYPGDKDSSYAQYMVGMSYYHQIIDVTRDQTLARKLYQSMNFLVKNYPESIYVADAQKKIRFAKNQLAAKHMFVGRYYQERNEYLAAINRFRVVVEKYSDTPQIEEALNRLSKSYYALGLIKEAYSTAALLGHNYPESKWYHHLYEILKDNLQEND